MGVFNPNYKLRVVFNPFPRIHTSEPPKTVNKKNEYLKKQNK
jgi:hypothetical protein